MKKGRTTKQIAMLKKNSKPRGSNKTFDIRSIFHDRNTSETEYDTHTKPYDLTMETLPSFKKTTPTLPKESIEVQRNEKDSHTSLPSVITLLDENPVEIVHHLDIVKSHSFSSSSLPTITTEDRKRSSISPNNDTVLSGIRTVATQYLHTSTSYSLRNDSTSNKSEIMEIPGEGESDEMDCDVELPPVQFTSSGKRNCFAKNKMQSHVKKRAVFDDDPDFEVTKKSKSRSLQSNNLKRKPLGFYSNITRHSSDNAEYFKNAKAPRLRRSNLSFTSPSRTPGASLDNPMCLDEGDENVTTPKDVYTPTLTSFSDWSVITFDVEYINFGNLRVLPVHVEADHDAIKMTVSYKRTRIQTTLTFKNIEVVRIHLHTDPLFIIVEPSGLLCRRLNVLLKAKFTSNDKMLLSAGSDGSQKYIVILLRSKMDEISLNNFKDSAGSKIQEMSDEEVDRILKSIVKSSEESVEEEDEDPLPNIPIVKDDDIVLTCQFQENKSLHTITGLDFHCLDEESYLNDKIINYFLMYYWDKLEEHRYNVHVFNSFFFSRLVDNSHDKPGLDTPERFHSRVQSWTKSVNIFDKTYVLVPVCYRAHWFIAILCNIGQYDPSIVEDIKVKNTNTSQYKKKKKRRNICIKRPRKKNIVKNEDEMMEVDEGEGKKEEEEIVEKEDEVVMKEEEEIVEKEDEVVMEKEDEVVMKEGDDCLVELSKKEDISQDDQTMWISDGDKCDNSDEVTCVDKVMDDDSATQHDILCVEDSSTESNIINDSQEVVDEDTNSVPEEKSIDIKPCVLVLDSMLVKRRNVGMNLKRYLTQEYTKRFPDSQFKDFKKLPIRFPNVPGQTNSYDCGVYMLTYVENFFKHIKSGRDIPIDQEWAPDMMNQKRRILKLEILAQKK